LELGSAHGGFVAMLRWAGFDAMGLELSPWIVEYASNIFQVPMLLGPLENQKIENNSLDGIFLMDVIEHLSDPVATINLCLNLLKTDGFLMIQTPRYFEGKAFETMNIEGDPFLRLLLPSEHLYLFSESSIRKFFNRLGVKNLSFERPMFDQYDMYFFVSREPLKTNSESEIEKALSASPSGRFIQAVLDLNQRYHQSLENLQECETDRAARLELIQDLSRHLQECETDRAARLELIQDLSQNLQESLSAKIWQIIRLLRNRISGLK
jgi:SAM-dependent methyltransferase